MIGRQLGSYTIVSPLGAGGMGEVYRAPIGGQNPSALDTGVSRYVCSRKEAS